MDFAWISHGSHKISNGFRMNFTWISYGFHRFHTISQDFTRDNHGTTPGTDPTQSGTTRTTGTTPGQPGQAWDNPGHRSDRGTGLAGPAHLASPSPSCRGHIAPSQLRLASPARTNETKRFPGWTAPPQPPISKFPSSTESQEQHAP